MVGRLLVRAAGGAVPRFRWRLADHGERATIALHGERDRRPLAVDRLAALGYRSQWRLERAFTDYIDWVEAHPELLQPSAAV